MVRAFALILSIAASIACFALAAQPPARAAQPVEIELGARRLEAHEVSPDAARDLARRWLDEDITLDAGARSVTLARRELGAVVDVTHLARLLADASDASSVMRRAAVASRLQLSMPASLEAERAEHALFAIKDAIDRRPTEARFDTTTHRLAPASDGLRVDVWSTLDAIDRALVSGARRVMVVTAAVHPHRSGSDIGELHVDSTLGWFETHYDASEKSEDRTFNLRVAASRLDGLVLLPGEELDFNEVVGERGEANGFRVAPVIASGELVDGIGGGTCQISGTLHGAVFFAGLPVIERHPHSRPSGYIKLGLDAAVSYPNLNFRFRNDRTHPIVISFRLEGGIARAAILGDEPPHVVSFTRRIDEVTPFDERVQDDASLPLGVRVLAQRGIPGFTTSSWRIVRDPVANQAVRQSFHDVYPPTPQIVRVGSGGPAPEGFVAPPGDGHREYVADEYLVMTQEPGARDFEESRRAGRTGAYGWQARAGMPQP